jgi:hypothetical protein
MYLSGQITGLSVEVYERNFDNAGYLARLAGWEPVNPITLAPVGADCCCTAAFRVGTGKHDWRCYLKRDLRELLSCSAIGMLEGWEVSAGARLENFVAINTGIPVYQIRLGRFELA